MRADASNNNDNNQNDQKQLIQEGFVGPNSLNDVNHGLATSDVTTDVLEDNEINTDATDKQDKQNTDLEGEADAGAGAGGGDVGVRP
jgi:hypothetical protein